MFNFEQRFIYFLLFPKVIILLLGCDRGFGHALAIKLDQMGFKVFAGCLFNKGDGAEALKRICSDQLHVLQLDVRDPEQVDGAYNAVEEKLNDYGENSLNKIKTNSLSICQKIFTL